jgi:8-oxo-dGTP pyrophosphatase MutT (NUDIX family)
MAFAHNDKLRQEISQRLKAFEVMKGGAKGLRPAAVAIVVAKHPSRDEAAVLLTLRPSHMNRHSNQFALPGGRLDQGETTEEAALRELQEELGVTLAPENILGCLDDYCTRSGFRISPVVLWAGGDLVLNPDPGEVDTVFHIPFSELNGKGMPLFMESKASDHPVLYSHLQTVGGSVYSPTAAMLYQFREVALRGNPTRVAHFDQPEFAWK